MKNIILLLLFSVMATAKDKNPADFPVVAHVVSRGIDSGSFVVGNSQLMQTSTVKFRAGNLTYVVGDMHCLSTVTVGSDVKARVEGRFFRVLKDDGKTCLAPLRGAYEDPQK